MRRLVGWICFLLVVLILAVTNPKMDDYVVWFRFMTANQTEDPLFRELVGLMAGPIVESTTVVRNYVVMTLFETRLG